MELKIISTLVYSYIYTILSAILYKLGNLFQCKQFLSTFCMSSNGNIFFDETQIICYKDNVRLNIFHKLYKQRNTIPIIRRVPIKIKKIISWNVQELWWFCYHRRKIDNIINYIVQSDADVICLQEVFEVDSIYKIVYNTNVYKNFPYFLTGNMYNRFMVGENSGLLILSKYPIHFKKFKQFPEAAFPDIFASKGALCFTVADQNFITTHLQADYLSIALKQLVFINKISPFKNDYILLGDLNLASPGKLFDIISNNEISTCDNGQILDHIISVSGKPMTISVDKINLENLSDHWPIVSILN